MFFHLSNKAFANLKRKIFDSLGNSFTFPKSLPFKKKPIATTLPQFLQEKKGRFCYI
ncbi:hypothetical protein SUB0193 [Streptococcus uberis 0140J]|uniref:Uncharacterized protein n=1 Tax=Streptococcus uberis (strain ATCC BAA-854 / 0140J) TaxID=218495 RepID=B9DT70_STRU0|nr:hypothetical protein SUB0193 [Streptococcus uberis 0140J]